MTNDNNNGLNQDGPDHPVVNVSAEVSRLRKEAQDLIDREARRLEADLRVVREEALRVAAEHARKLAEMESRYNEVRALRGSSNANVVVTPSGPSQQQSASPEKVNVVVTPLTPSQQEDYPTKVNVAAKMRSGNTAKLPKLSNLLNKKGFWWVVVLLAILLVGLCSVTSIGRALFAPSYEPTPVLEVLPTVKSLPATYTPVPVSTSAITPPTAVPTLAAATSAAEIVAPATAVVSVKTAVPTAVRTAVVVPTSAPPVPVFVFNSGPQGSAAVPSGAVCHGDMVSVDGVKYGDGIGPANPVFLVLPRAAEVEMIWGSCITEETPDAVFSRITAQYSKTFDKVQVP